MKRLSAVFFFVFSLITGLQPLSIDDGYIAARKVVTAAVDKNVEIAPPRGPNRGGDSAAVPGQTIRSDVKTLENIFLRALNLLFEQMELGLHLTLYKVRLIYKTIISPIISLLWR